MLQKALLTIALFFSVSAAQGSFIAFEVAGGSLADIIATRDAFRTAVGGGTVGGANGSFGGVRREINWDGVPTGFADPNVLPANFFNVNSPRGVVFNTPGTGFMVSANGTGSTPALFGFSGDFQVFSAPRLFTAIGSSITDINFFVPGTSSAATTSAFGLIFVDVDVADLTKLEFFDQSNALIFSRNAFVSGTAGLTFLGGVANAGEQISRVRITSGQNTLSSNGALGNLTGDMVVMDDFLYAEPIVVQRVPEPPTFLLLSLGFLAVLTRRRSRVG